MRVTRPVPGHQGRGRDFVVQADWSTVSRPIGGILSADPRGPAGGHPSVRPTWGLLLSEPGGPPGPTLGLAPGGVYLAARSPGSLVRSYRTVSPLPVRRGAIGGLLSVALSCGSPRLAVSQHPALWSPDLPRSGPGRTR